jgi:DNA repair protein RadC
VQDLNLTRKLKESAALMDIQLIDHLIIYNEQFFSFADQGKL